MESKAKFYTVIEINEEKVRREGACDLKQMYSIIDGLFAKYKLPRIPTDGNLRIYRNGNSKQDFGMMWNINLLLREKRWFVCNVNQWKWCLQENPDDPNDIIEEDLIVGYIMPYVKNGVWEFKQEI